MTQLTIRQSGGANIISIPKAVLGTLGLGVSSLLDLTIVDSKIVLTPITRKPTLEDLLKGSAKDSFEITDEDREWLDRVPRGKEIL